MQKRWSDNKSLSSNVPRKALFWFIVCHLDHECYEDKLTPSPVQSMSKLIGLSPLSSLCHSIFAVASPDGHAKDVYHFALRPCASPVYLIPLSGHSVACIAVKLSPSWSDPLSLGKKCNIAKLKFWSASYTLAEKWLPIWIFNATLPKYHLVEDVEKWGREKEDTMGSVLPIRICCGICQQCLCLRLCLCWHTAEFIV